MKFITNTSLKLILFSTIIFTLTFCNGNNSEKNNTNNNSKNEPKSSNYKTAKLSNKYKFELVRKLPHNKESFTQGLLYRNGIIYESTGLIGKSTIQKIDYNTGNVIKSQKLPSDLFAEGITFVNNQIYMLTYQNKVLLILDTNLNIISQNIKYDGEGWGLIYDGTKLIKSNGSDIIEYRNPINFAIMSENNIIDDFGNPRYYINEMEYINDNIWANIWGTPFIVVINPKTNKVEERYNFDFLFDMLKTKDGIDVMNGIAYVPENNTILLTGKHWDTMFEYKLVRE